MQSRIRQAVLAAVVAIACAAAAASGARAATAPEHPIDINKASAEELASLPGIGESKAKAIVEYRAADPFHSIEDLKKVKGIGDKTFETLRPNLTVSEAGGAK